MLHLFEDAYLENSTLDHHYKLIHLYCEKRLLRVYSSAGFISKYLCTCRRKPNKKFVCRSHWVYCYARYYLCPI